MRLRLAIAALLLSAATALAQDAGPDGDAAAAPPGDTGTTYIDFGDEEALGGGEMVAPRDPAPTEHETLMPERYRTPTGPAAEPAPPASKRRGGCSGCAPALLGAAFVSLFPHRRGR